MLEEVSERVEEKMRKDKGWADGVVELQWGFHAVPSMKYVPLLLFHCSSHPTPSSSHPPDVFSYSADELALPRLQAPPSARHDDRPVLAVAQKQEALQQLFARAWLLAAAREGQGLGRGYV